MAASVLLPLFVSLFFAGDRLPPVALAGLVPVLLALVVLVVVEVVLVVVAAAVVVVPPEDEEEGPEDDKEDQADAPLCCHPLHHCQWRLSGSGVACCAAISATYAGSGVMLSCCCCCFDWDDGGGTSHHRRVLGSNNWLSTASTAPLTPIGIPGRQATAENDRVTSTARRA